MSVRLARLQSIPDEVEEQPEPVENRRREQRFSALFDAEISNSHGDSATALIAEVSLHGCRIQTDAKWLKAGAFISIRIEDSPSLQAIVRWIRDGSAGMEFLRPIPAQRREWHDLMDSGY